MHNKFYINKTFECAQLLNIIIMSNHQLVNLRVIAMALAPDEFRLATNTSPSALTRVFWGMAQISITHQQRNILRGVMDAAASFCFMIAWEQIGTFHYHAAA